MVKRFEQSPYTFRPPRYRAWLAPPLQFLNRQIFVKRKFRTGELEMSGVEPILRAYRGRIPILITPNHSDHCDPYVLLEVARRMGLPFHYMAARESFEASHGMAGWFMQQVGAFSVDRDGADRRSIMTSIGLLVSGRAPLVIFPEGEIYHTSERLAPLNEGAATILLRVAAKRAKTGDGDAYLVPTAIRYKYIEDVTPTFGPSMDELEGRISWEAQRNLPIVDRIYKFGEALLATKEREWLGHPLEGSLVERLEAFRIELLEPLEAKHGLEGSGVPVPERVKRLRNKIRGLLFAEDTEAVRIEECRDDLNRLFVAVQLYSYPGQYLSETPTQERIAETILKLQEDVLNRPRIPGRRKVTIEFAEPLNAADLLEDYSRNARQTVEGLTKTLEARIGEMLLVSETG